MVVGNLNAAPTRGQLWRATSWTLGDTAVTQNANAKTVTPTVDAETKMFGRLLATLRQLVRFDTYHVVGYVAGSPYGSLVLATDWPAEFAARYLAEKWFESDPEVVAICAADQPIGPAEVARAAEGNSLLRCRLDARADILGGEYVGIPVFRHGMRRGAIAFTRRQPAFSPEERALLAMATPALHLTASQLPRAQAFSLLSPRERECLNWASHGKTAWEISEILGISEFTAVAHLNGAVRKLGALSRCHAVAEAIRRGLLD